MSSSSSGLPEMAYRVLVLIYGMAIAVALLNDGAAQITSLSLLALPIFVLLIGSICAYGFPANVFSAVLAAVVLWGLSLAWLLLQTISLPGEVLANPAWRDLPDGVVPQRVVLSVTPAEDWLAFFRLSLPFGVFLLGLRIFDNDARASAALKFLAASGGLIAAAAIAQFRFAPEMLLLAPKTAYFDSLTGFFVNRNTSATFFGLAASLNLALVLQASSELELRRILISLEQRRGMPWREKRTVMKVALYAALLILCLIALMLTRSRAGIVASIFALTLIIFLFALRSGSRTPVGAFAERGKSSRVGKLLIALMIALGGGAVFLAFAGRALLRIEIQGAEDGRFCVAPGTVSAVLDHLPWGAGLAGFSAIFPAYRDPVCGISHVWDRAHNVYLEGMLGLGILFPLLVAIGLVFLAQVLLKGLRNRRSLRYAAEAGAAMVTLVVMHSTIDFSLQVPGFAIVFAVSLAPVVTISLKQLGGRSRLRSGQTLAV